jgi:hypothetical protein
MTRYTQKQFAERTINAVSCTTTGPKYPARPVTNIPLFNTVHSNSENHLRKPPKATFLFGIPLVYCSTWKN